MEPVGNESYRKTSNGGFEFTAESNTVPEEERKVVDDVVHVRGHHVLVVPAQGIIRFLVKDNLTY